MTSYLLIFVAGIAGSWHCVGMCGGFACALGPIRAGAAATAGAPAHLQSRPRDDLLLPRRAGRLPRRRAVRERRGGAPPTVARRSASWRSSSGLLMVVIGLQLLGWLRRRHGPPRSASAAAPGRGAARPAARAGAGGTARLRRAQRLPALPAGLRLRRPGGGQRRRRCPGCSSCWPSASAPSRRCC